MVGTAHEVVSAYEAAMFAGERSQGLQRGGGTKAQFLRWEISRAGGSAAEEPHTLRTLDPVTIDFFKNQNAYTRSVLDMLGAPRQRLFARIKQLDNVVASVSSVQVAGLYLYL